MTDIERIMTIFGQFYNLLNNKCGYSLFVIRKCCVTFSRNFDLTKILFKLNTRLKFSRLVDLNAVAFKNFKSLVRNQMQSGCGANFDNVMTKFIFNKRTDA